MLLTMSAGTTSLLTGRLSGSESTSLGLSREERECIPQIARRSAFKRAFEGGKRVQVEEHMQRGVRAKLSGTHLVTAER